MCIRDRANEFRTNNIKLTKQVEQLGLKGLTSGESTGANEEQVQALIEDAVSDMRIKLDGFETEKNALQSQLEEVVLSDRVKDIAIQHGVFESALPDIVSRARTVFTVKDGKPVPLDKKSRDEDGNVLNPESWLKKLQDDATHLFKPSNGSGATRPNGNGRQSGMREQANRKSTDKIADGLKNRAGSGKTAKQVM